jgi:CBS domain-containing protein
MRLQRQIFLLAKGEDMDLKKLGSKRVVTVTADTSLEDAARLMRENHVGDVVIVESKGSKKIPIGILTDRDIVMATIALGAPAAPLATGDIMTSDLVTIKEDESLNHLIDLMKEKGVKRVPIVGKDCDLLGIIALEDVMALLTKELAALAEVGKRQKEVEFQRRQKFA